MEDERWLMMAVLDHLQKVSKRGDVKEEPIKEAISALSNAYSLNMYNSVTKERYPLDGLSLPEVYKTGRAHLLSNSGNGEALKATTPLEDAMDVEVTSVMDKDPVFQKFLARLKETTNFFKNVQPGTAEYNKRVSKAWEKFQTKRTEKKKRKAESTTGAASSGTTPRTTPPVSSGSMEAEHAQAAKLKEEGNAALKAKDYQKAHDLYSKSIELDAENAVYYSNRAAAKLHLARYSEAVDDCKQAIALDPMFLRPRERLAASYRYLGMTKNEIDTLKALLDVVPHNEAFEAQLRDAEARLGGTGGAGSVGNGTGGGFAGLESLLGRTDPAVVTNMARSMGMQLPEGAVENFLSSGNAADQLGSMMRENPGFVQQAMRMMMGGGGNGNSNGGANGSG